LPVAAKAYEPSLAKPFSGVDAKPRESGGLPPSNQGTSNGERWKEIVLYALISLISYLCGVSVLGLLIRKPSALVEQKSHCCSTIHGQKQLVGYKIKGSSD
jgi:hypothetical protein